MKYENTSLKIDQAVRIQQLLKEHNANYSTIGYDSRNVYVYIEHGDWKDHIYVENLIKGLYPNCAIYNQILDEDGSDCYSAKHVVEF